MILRVTVTGKDKDLRSGSEAKASLNRAKVACGRPEARRSTHGQNEVTVIGYGGSNR